MVAEQIVDTFFQVNNLEFDQLYFWQVIVTDGIHDPVYSPVWQFKTRVFPDARIHFARRIDNKYQVFGFTEADSTIRIIEGPNNYWRPRMDPARERIAFLSIADLKTHLYVSDRVGKNIRQVTTVPVVTYDNLNTAYCWSPDGARLLYANNNLLYTVNVDGTGLTVVSQAPSGQRFAEVDWNQNTNLIVARTVENFHYESRLYLIEPGGAAQVLLDSVPGSYSSPSFSIDGSQLLYCHDVTNFPSPDGRQLDTRIFLLDLQTNQGMDLSFDKVAGTNDLQVRFSPTGAVLIFVNTLNDGVTPKNIWTMKISGLDREPMIMEGEMPDWQ
jgi:TolB protein